MAAVTDSSPDEKISNIGSDEDKRRPSWVPGPGDGALEVLQQIKLQDQHHPVHWPIWKKWYIISVYCLLQVFVTLTSTSYIGIEFNIEAQFGSPSLQVVTLGQSLFIVGNAVGPAFLGPLSDLGGRKWIYVGSILVFAILNIGTANALNLPMLVIFQFLAGAAGSTALSNVAGTIADLFGDADDAGQAMALFVWAANTGPSLGGPVGVWVSNLNNGLSWLFYINVIIGAAFAFWMCFVPETLPRVVIAREARKAQTTSPDEVVVMETKVNVLKEARFILTMALRIMVTEPIVTFLAVYNGFAYGLLFLYLDGVYDVFALNNGLTLIGAELTYLNFVVGVTIMFMIVPLQTYLYKRDRLKRGGVGRPEARFLLSMVTVWGFPISLFWFAFTSNGNYSYWSPVVAGGLLGIVDPLLYLSMLNYITDAYPNVAASAVAAFLIPSFIIAAAFAHIGLVMFNNMSTTWAAATLAFISLGLVALIYVLFFFGPQLRKWSKLARTF